MQFIVFGINGYIGSHIFRELKKDNYKVLGTSRREQKADSVVSYDIQKDDIQNVIAQFSEKDKIAIICIAEPNIDKCYENYDDAYDINVTKTKKLIQELIKEGFYVVYFSTDNVFDGVSGSYTEESVTHAVNKYGMMKAEMEHYLLENEPEVCILRIPKVVSAMRVKQNIFEEWYNQKGSNIRCIKGNIISFVYIDDIYQACVIAAKKKLRGLYNIAGDNAYSRALLAQKFFDKLGVQNTNIMECELSDFSFKDVRPLNVGLKNLKFKIESGYQFTDINKAIEMYINCINEV